MRINNNITAINAHRQYGINNAKISGSVEKLSSGYRINRAGDDAAGLAISEKMRAQIRGLEMASKNSSDAISLVQTAEGALQETHNILQRMRELAVQSASDTNESTIDRAALDAEFQQLKEEIDEIARTTRFNDQNLIDGTFQKAFYSTDITYANLTNGTVANVSRVGVKSNHNMDGIYDIDAKYIAGKETVYARKAEVDTQVADASKKILLSSDAAGTSIINRVDFNAVVGAEHNGKTFTISASGDGIDLANLNVTISDGDSTWTGTVTATNRMEGGSEISISFDGVGTMTLFLDDDIAEADQKVYNIASSLNNKQFKFIEAYEVNASTGLGASGAHEVAAATDYVATASAGGTVVASGNGAITGEAASIAITASTVAWDASATPGISGGATATVDGSTVTATVALTDVDTVTTDASGTTLTGGTMKFQVEIDDGSDNYGTYEISVTVGIGDNASTVEGLISSALQALQASTTVAPSAYTIETNFDAASATTAALDSSLDVTDGTVTVGVDANGAITGIDASSVAVDFTDALGNTTNPAVTATVNYAPKGLIGEMNITFDVAGYGSFEMHIGANEGRTAADLETEIATALEAITQDLGKLNKGVDSVKATDAAIALTLNGEVVTLHENDTNATFDSSGISLSFNALDFSKVSSNDTAAARFTNQGGSTVSIRVEEAAGKALTVQTGANQGDELKINIDAMNLELLGLTDSSIASQKSASRAITEVNNAINQVSTQRAALGALQNRLNHKIANLDTSAENLQAAESRIRDVDMAKEMTEFTKNNILSQASTAMLAQANALPQGVLQLLG